MPAAELRRLVGRLLLPDPPALLGSSGILQLPHTVRQQMLEYFKSAWSS
jgi:hypothetical protein